MELKIAEYSDYEQIAQLHARSWRSHYQGILGDDYLQHDVLEERLGIWQARLINPPFNQHVVLLLEGGLLCGFICAFGNHDFERGTLIDSLHVDDNYRGRAIGTQLLSEITVWLEQYFPNNGVYLEVMEKNQQAVDFYEHIGGEQTTKRLWNAPCGHQVDELIYAWKSPKVLSDQLQSHKVSDLVTG